MARKTKATVEEIEEVDEVEEVEEIAEELDDEGDGDGLTAKELARALGTDGRTIRKFLRHKFGKVGQGQRWNISSDKVDELKAEFSTWGKRTRGEKKAKKVTPEADEGVESIEELDNDELEDLSDIEELDDLDSILEEDD